jgi:hypothetical protein
MNEMGAPGRSVFIWSGATGAGAVAWQGQEGREMQRCKHGARQKMSALRTRWDFTSQQVILSISKQPPSGLLANESAALAVPIFGQVPETSAAINYM